MAAGIPKKQALEDITSET